MADPADPDLLAFEAKLFWQAQGLAAPMCE